jgi:hypothetical protein
MCLQPSQTQEAVDVAEVLWKRAKGQGRIVRSPQGSGGKGTLGKNLRIQEAIPKDREGDLEPITIYSSLPQNTPKA